MQTSHFHTPQVKHIWVLISRLSRLFKSFKLILQFTVLQLILSLFVLILFYRIAQEICTDFSQHGGPLYI